MVVKTALRGTVLVTFGLATAAAVLGFVTPCASGAAPLGEGVRRAVILALLVAPALRAWRQPTPRRFVGWAAFAWIVAIPALLVVGHMVCDPAAGTAWIAKAGRVGAFAVLVIATCGAPVAAWLAAAAERPRAPDSLLARRLRRLVEVAAGLGVALAVVGGLPGMLLQDGAGQLHAAPAGGVALAIYVAMLLAPAAVVHVDPQRRSAFVWSLWALPMTLVGFALVDPSDCGIVAEMWPRHFVEAGMGTLIALILLVLPLVWIFTREGEPQGELPEARLTDSAARATDRSRRR